MTQSFFTRSSSKRRKLSNEEAKFNTTTIDRISMLPDSLLCHILSFLPTKHAGVTSVLSTRWKYLWTLVPTLDFEDPAARCKFVHRRRGDRSGLMSFVHFVYRVLVLRDNAACVKKFRLKCTNGNCDSFHFSTWVCAAMARGVEELDLHMVIFERPVELPRTLFTCKTLRVLKLRSGIVINVPSSVHFPILKFLHLHYAKFPNDDSFRKLLCGCPVLEELIIEGFRRAKVKIFDISAPALKNLTMVSLLPHLELDSHKIEINCPALEYLYIRDWALEYLNLQNRVGEAVSIENASSLVEAKVDFYAEMCDNRQGNCAFELLRRLYNVKFLSILGNTMETLKFASSYEMPMFHNLTRLKIAGDWHLLPNFLESSHNLEVLSLDRNHYHSDGRACWRQPQRVPKCLSLHLKTIDVRFKGLKYELLLVKYLLKNAEVLKTVDVRCCRLKSKEKSLVLKKISLFSRGSKTCQLTFH